MATPKNVYELAQERLELIFREFDTICVSFSGGKDSGVLLNLCIDYIRRNNLKRKLCVYHMDYEIQYSMTIDYVDRILEANKDILEVYRVCVPFKVTTCTSMYQNYWRPWDPEMEEIWVRQMPKGSMDVKSFPFYTDAMWGPHEKDRRHGQARLRKFVNTPVIRADDGRFAFPVTFRTSQTRPAASRSSASA